ncbi:MAG: L-2-amino-thiazoline-4-carboxylic acid hydrolase [Candidatus Thorarchaeota archaeon]
MKFVRTGKYREDTLERSVEINSLDEARGRFKRMNYLLGFVKVQKPEDFPEYVLNLISKYDSLLKDERKISNPLDLDELVSDNPNLKEHLELAIVVLNYFRQILQLPTESKLGKIEVVNRNYFRSFSHISYPNLLVLTETIGRDEAISLYKRFVTHYTLENRDPNRETIDDLETLFAKRTEPKEVPSDWEIVHTMLADGKYAFRNDNCVFLNAIGEDLPDSELKYYVCCYGDYEKFRNYHDSVILTMEHTIAQGDPYCSRVLHDTRVDWNLQHPPKSFWDSMEPDNEH